MILFNFLPKSYIKDFKRDIIIKFLYTFLVFNIFWIFILGTTLFSAYQYLSIQNKSLENRIIATQSLKNTTEAEQIESEINKVNNLPLRIDKIRQTQPYEFSDLIEHLAPMVPAGSSLNSLVFSANSNELIIEGNSSLRTHIITLQERLEKSAFFGDIEAPLSNLLKAQDVDFQFKVHLIREG